MSALSRRIWSHSYRYLTLLLLAMTCTALQAHESSTAYLNLQTSNSKAAANINYNAKYELSLRDLALLVDIDSNQETMANKPKNLENEENTKDLNSKSLGMHKTEGDTPTPPTTAELHRRRMMATQKKLCTN